MITNRSIARIVDFIKEKNDHLDTEGAAIGLSGGLDSAVCAALSCLALGPNHCLGIAIPAWDSNLQDAIDAEEIARYLGMQFTTHPLGLGEFRFVERDFEKEVRPLILKMDKLLPPQIELPYIMKLRGRMLIVTYYARQNNYFQCETLNKTEWLLGWHDKFGDGVGDIAPIRHLYKTQVYDIAQELVKVELLPELIISRKSGSGNYPMGNKEELGGLSFERVDKILQGETGEEGIFSGVETKKIQHLVEISRRKREIPYIIGG